MSTLTALTSSSAHTVLRARSALSADAFESIRRRMMLEFCKWDPQVGDVSTLANFPLALARSQWNELSATAEALAQETMQIEERLLDRPELHRRLGLPSKLRRVLRSTRRIGVTPGACRVMRFDFHQTCDGWRVSEINCDVPGGFSEASRFAELVAGNVCGVTTAGDPQKIYADALARGAQTHGGAVVLLVAPGFMEDQQIVAGLAHELENRGVHAILAGPAQLRWTGGRAFLDSICFRGEIALIVRFYQGEWLAQLPRHVRWQRLFVGGRTPVANPGSAILTESKRLPLVWDELGIACSTWKRVLPETRDPRDAPWRRDAGWLLKTAFCNTGDSVTIRELLPKETWRKRWIDVALFPRQWVAQRRFETIAIDTPMGMMFPCIGVYTIDGRACGIYGRMSPTPVIDYSAVDVAVLVENGPREVLR